MNGRDLELLSAYLDGELKPSDSTKLEARLKTDPELASVLDDLRAARTLLRRLPSRKAPRNFTLTRKMVGLNPPLPRAYSMFRFATAAATLLFFFSVGLNFMGAQLASQPPAFGMGGGGQVESFAAEESAPAAPQASDAAPAEEPSISMAPPQGTEIPSTEDTARILETPSAKDGAEENAVGEAEQLPVPPESRTGPAPLIPSAWQVALLAVALIGTLLMGVMRRSSARRWK